jgi:molybdopterin-guanine dinucleotide biosynthesis protein A
MHDALVLAGGGARRMGGVDKPGLAVGGIPLLDRVLTAVASADQVVVVGPARPTALPVLWTREEPAGAGPVAAVAAGLSLVRAPVVLLLAGDLPFLTPEVVDELLDFEHDGALLVDSDGREQYLCSAWRTDSLRATDLTCDRLGRLLAPLSARRVSVTSTPPPWTDCDTEDDLRRARKLA